MWISFLAVGLGSALGGMLRWRVTGFFAGRGESLYLGTWSVNVLAGFLAGLGMAVFAQKAHFWEPFRLFVVVGFCGGLSTFSAFSAEVVHLIQEGRLEHALGLSLAHVLVSVLATFAGVGLIHLLRAPPF